MKKSEGIEAVVAPLEALGLGAVAGLIEDNIRVSDQMGMLLGLMQHFIASSDLDEDFEEGLALEEQALYRHFFPIAGLEQQSLDELYEEFYGS